MKSDNAHKFCNYGMDAAELARYLDAQALLQAGDVFDLCPNVAGVLASPRSRVRFDDKGVPQSTQADNSPASTGPGFLGSATVSECFSETTASPTTAHDTRAGQGSAFESVKIEAFRDMIAGLTLTDVPTVVVFQCAKLDPTVAGSALGTDALDDGDMLRWGDEGPVQGLCS